MTRKNISISRMAQFTIFLFHGLLLSCSSAQDEQPNILLITVDDMNFDTPGCFGGEKDLTPNIDRLAARGMRFEQAHVALAICQASRQCLMTGRYPHNAGFRWFEPVADGVPILTELLHEQGYINACFGKAEHLQPRERYIWDESLDLSQIDWGRDPARYYELCRSFIEKARNNDQPFFLMANSHDPHRPFHSSEDEAEILEKLAERKVKFTTPSQVYNAEEAIRLGFLPYIPEVKKQTAQYMSSCRRADDTVGEILRALKESGEWDNTVIFFLSDNGSAFPFAKGNVYVNGTRTPFIASWDGHIQAGTVNGSDYINGIDFMPTVLDILGLSSPAALDGRSLYPLLKGERQEGRNSTVTTFYNVYPVAGGRRPELTNWFEMRCLHRDGYSYIYNSWADGERRFTPLGRPEIQENMLEHGFTERVNMFRYRCPEELYKEADDPDALKNLIHSPENKDMIQEMRIELLEWMEKYRDTDLLPEFRVVAEQEGFDEEVPRGEGYEHIKPVTE